MDKLKINRLIRKFEILDIEKHLIYLYLKFNNLDYFKSPLLRKFFEDFIPNKDMLQKCSALDIKDLKTLEKYLELLIPRNDRKLNGAFFTPTYIVNFIIKETSPTGNEKCLDPSCGSGAFLIGLVEYFKAEYNKPVKNILQENIFGADILDYNVRRAKVLLAIMGLMHNEIIEEGDFNIKHIDSLKYAWNEKFDVIVGNPPYVRYQDLNDENRNYLSNYWETINNGTFNLYFAFFELGHKLLKETGRLGYITPNNYFTSLAGLPLRQYFHRNKCLKRIIDFSHKKVFDAQTYTAISFLNKHENDAVLYDRIQESQVFSEFLANINGSPNYFTELNVKKWRLLKSREQENIKIIENIGTPLYQLFDITVGIATLKDEVFFVDSSTEENGLFIKNSSKGTFFIEKEITRPVYKISNIKDQKDIENNTLRIITPYKLARKNAIPIPEKEFKITYPNCYDYLLSEKENLKNRDKGKAIFEPFYVWGRTQGINRRGKKIINPTFSKHPRFLFVPEEDAYFTNGYGMFFKNNSKGLFEELDHPISKEENAILALKILNSVIMEYYVNTTSVSIQGGYPCYQKNFIEKFTIPNFTEREIEILNNLTDKHEIDSFLINKYQLNISVPKRFSYT